MTVFTRPLSRIHEILTGNVDMHESPEDSKFGQIRPPTAELAALERLKKSQNNNNGGKRCCHLFSAVLDQILFVLAGNDGIHKSLDEFTIRPDRTKDHRVSCP